MSAGPRGLSQSENYPRLIAVPQSKCRFCAAPLRETFVDLGMSPLCESYLTADQLGSPEPFYPLQVKVCGSCWLVQLDQFVSPAEIEFTVDKNPYKQGRFLPGTHIAIHSPEKIDEARPDYILVLPWNFKDEILTQLTHARSWGAKFVVPIPEATVLS